MKRNNLTTAVVAAITGVAGIASVSNAVNLNSDGVGQVLVYPYYTVNKDLLTLISVVNTSDHVKAVKVRFLEGKNSRECLDFNLYLSPYDVWVGQLKATTSTASFAGSFYAGQESVRITTPDTSCIVPQTITDNGYEFLPWGFDPQGNGSSTDGYDGGGRDLQRCTEGHFEMIDMGMVTDIGTNNAATSATHDHHADGQPAEPVNCGQLESNWSVGGVWAIDGNVGLVAPDAAGGLFGSASIVDVKNGTDVTYNADAIQAYTTAVQHSNPGNLTPNLATGGIRTSNIFNDGQVQSDTWLSSSVQAVSALYMHDQIYGEYALQNTIGANTELVVTFPTKFAYVDPIFNVFGLSYYEPFTVGFAGGTACERYEIEYWDREEQQRHGDVADLPPSPLPPGIPDIYPIFCWETNVLELHDEVFDDSLASTILGSNNTTHYATQHENDPTYFDAGWIRLTFTQSTDDNVDAATLTFPSTYTGLPVTGFAIQRYANGEVTDGVDENGDPILLRANYAGLFKHRYTKNITS